MKVTLLNTTIVTSDGLFEIETIPLEEVKEICGRHTVDSAIGHKATAQVLSGLLGFPVEAKRQEYCQGFGEIAIAFKLNKRIAEGQILSAQEIEEIGYTFKSIVKVK